MNVFNIERAFKRNKAKGWEKTYWLIDVHDTIIRSTHDKYVSKDIMYPYAEEVLKILSQREDVVLILWTSSYPDYVEDLRKWLFHQCRIHFDYFNENPECGNTETADLGKKFYYDIVIDDKAGFEAETDWKLILDELIRIGEI